MTSSNFSPLHSSSIVFRKTTSLPSIPFFFNSVKVLYKAARRFNDCSGARGGKNGRSFCGHFSRQHLIACKLVQTYHLRFFGVVDLEQPVQTPFNSFDACLKVLLGRFGGKDIVCDSWPVRELVKVKQPQASNKCCGIARTWPLVQFAFLQDWTCLFCWLDRTRLHPLRHVRSCPDIQNLCVYTTGWSVMCLVLLLGTLVGSLVRKSRQGDLLRVRGLVKLSYL